MTTADELLGYIFDGKKSPLYAEFERWIRASRRFRLFASQYQTKIRAKLRNVQHDSGLADLQAELETAALLLQEERFTLEYEKYTAAKQRGPDYTVTFKSYMPFNVEVRRMRGTELDAENSAAHRTKLMAVLCDKAGQMPPGILNLLWLRTERELLEADISQAAASLRQLAERKVEDFFTRRGFASAAVFLKQYGQLSGIVTLHAGTPLLWQNGLARRKIPPDLAAALQRLTVS